MGLLRNFKKEMQEDIDSEHVFLEEIDKFQKDKLRQEKIGQLYQNSENKKEILLKAMELKNQKIQKAKLNRSMEMVKFNDILLK